MANEVVIQIKDRSKTAICRETLALCGKYSVTVEDMLADGVLVLHDRMYLPNVWPYDPKGAWAAPSVDEAQWYGYCTLTDGEGDLDLSMERLVTKLSKTHPLNTVAQVQFSVYKTGEGLIGTGEMQVLVTEPYTTSEQSFVSFKGDPGEKGETGSTGPQGQKGDTGEQGLQGVQGERGFTGLAGVSSIVTDTKGCLHRLKAVFNSIGELVLSIVTYPYYYVNSEAKTLCVFGCEVEVETITVDGQTVIDGVMTISENNR